jgi:hypothetical protein
MIGPKSSSLLHKLGLKMAHELSDQELQEIVAKDQKRRTIERAMGRAQKMMAEDDESISIKKVGRPRTRSRVKAATSVAKDFQPTLESYGLKPELCQKLRAGGKADWQLILELTGAGIL